MYTQRRFVISVRGSGFDPTTAASAESGVSGFMNAGFTFRFAFGFALGLALGLAFAAFFGFAFALAFGFAFFIFDFAFGLDFFAFDLAFATAATSSLTGSYSSNTRPTKL